MMFHSFRFRGELLPNTSYMTLTDSNRYANRCACFIHAYTLGLDGPEAAWANRRYHRHRTLPPEMLITVKEWAAEMELKAKTFV